MGSRVPDYQGMFLRGVGGNSASLGVQQGDAIRNMTGDAGRSLYIKNGHIDATFSPSPSGVFKTYAISTSRDQGWYFQYGGGGDPHNTISDTIMDASRQVPTASENRPINKAVRYLIRAKS